MCSIDWLIFLEYVKIIFSWPPIALIIALFLGTRFRTSVDNLIQRVVGGEFLGQRFTAAAPNQQSDTAPGTIDKLTEAANRPTNSIAVENTETQEISLTNLPPELSGDPNAVNAVNYVKTHPIETVIEYKRVVFAHTSEKLFRKIFGTQIELLEYLQSMPDKIVTLAQLARFHIEHQRKADRTDYQITEYINFLSNNGVIQVSGPENALEYKISQSGINFLSYLKANYPESWNHQPY